MIHNNRQSGVRAILFAAAISTAMLYTALQLPSGLTRVDSIVFLMAAMIILLLFCLGLLFILWSILVSPLVRKFDLSPTAAALALAAFVLVNSAFDGLNHSAASTVSMTSLLHTGFYLLVAAAVAIGVYFTSLDLQVRGPVKIKALLPAVPFVMLELVLFVYWHKYIKLNAFYSPISLLLSTAVLAAAVVLTCALTCRYHRYFLSVKYWMVKYLMLIVIGVLVFSSQYVFSGPDSVHSQEHKIKYVILIVIDSLRADALSCYNANAVHTPAIDAFAAQSVLFENALTCSPWTTPSMASILTGLSPFVHQATQRHSRLSGTFVTLAEKMQSAGYVTAGIGSNPVLGARRNLDQGFHVYDFYPKGSFPNEYLMRTAQKLMPEHFRHNASTKDLADLAIQWVKKNKQHDFFLWLHFFDPHLPYTPPDAFLPDVRPVKRIGRSFSRLKDIRGGYFVPDAAEKDWIRALYDAEIEYVDLHTGRLLNSLRDMGIYDQCLIILTSDHGEEFWDHGGYEHGHSLYNELLHVPLMVKHPDQTASKKVRQRLPVSGIMPTVLQACRLSFNEEFLSYPSLLPWVLDKGQKPEVSPIFCTGLLYYENREAVIYDNKKFIRFTLSGQELFYNLQSDPHEQNPVNDRPGIKRSKQFLKDHKETALTLQNVLNVQDADSVQVNSGTLERLRSLGYVN